MASLKERLLAYPKLFKKNGTLNGYSIKNEGFLDSELYTCILANTSYLDSNVLVAERLYNVIQSKNELTKCSTCNTKIVKFINFSRGYVTYCSSKCSNLSKEVQDKIKKTNMERYGVTNYAKTKEYKNKSEKTSLEKYGVKYHSQTQYHKEQVIKTSLEKYGVKHFTQTKKCQMKKLQTNNERYGVSHYSQTEECKSKVIETNKEKYGSKFYSKTPECKEQVIKTNLDKYGVKHFTQTQEYIDKTVKTNLEKYGKEFYLQTSDCKTKSAITNQSRYGVDNYAQKNVSQDTLNKMKDKEWLIEQHLSKGKSLSLIAHELGDIKVSSISKYYKKHNIEVKQHSGQSLPEKLLIEYIQKSFKTNVDASNSTIIKPYEIDIYLPELKLAIEFNGIYWHRPEVYGGYDLWFKYHQHKINLCDDKGIKLLHLWENHGNHEELITDAIDGNIVNNLEEIYNILYKGK